MQQELYIQFLRKELNSTISEKLLKLGFPEDILEDLSFSMTNDFIKILKAEDFDLVVSGISQFIINAELKSGISRFVSVDSETKKIGIEKQPFIWTNGCYDVLDQNNFASDNNFVYLNILWEVVESFVNEYFLNSLFVDKPNCLSEELKTYHGKLLKCYNEVITGFWNSVVDDCFDCYASCGQDLVHIPYDKILSAAYIRMLTTEQLASLPIEYKKDDQEAIITENVMALSELFEIAKVIKPRSKPSCIKSSSAKSKYRTYRHNYSQLLNRSLKFKSMQTEFDSITFSINMHNFAMIYQKMEGDKIDNKQMYPKIFNKIQDKKREILKYADGFKDVHVQVIYNPNSNDKFSLFFGHE